MNHPLSPDEYQEPVCPLCMNPSGSTIPIHRVIRRLDEFLSRNDYSAAKRLLAYWIDEARALGDARGELSLHDEGMGLFRKCAEREEAYAHTEKALSLLSSLGLENTVTAATVRLNAATVYKAFGEPEKALPLYEKAMETYRRDLPPKDARLAGLLNNRALALCDLDLFSEAEENLREAIAIQQKVPNGQADEAISWLNLADLFHRRDGESAEKAVDDCLRQALSLLQTPSLPRDGYYAFVCEKCAPTFRFYGYFADARELAEQARRIYERA